MSTASPAGGECRDDTAERGLQRWYDAVAARDAEALNHLLADDAVFHPPAVHRAQHGRALVQSYLAAAMAVLGEDIVYVDEWVRGREAVLEFVSQVDGVEVHGVDLITWNADGLICTFTLMVRPLKGLNMLMARMGEQLHGRVQPGAGWPLNL